MDVLSQSRRRGHYIRIFKNDVSYSDLQILDSFDEELVLTLHMAFF